MFFPTEIPISQLLIIFDNQTVYKFCLDIALLISDLVYKLCNLNIININEKIRNKRKHRKNSVVYMYLQNQRPIGSVNAHIYKLV